MIIERSLCTSDRPRIALHAWLAMPLIDPATPLSNKVGDPHGTIWEEGRNKS